MSMRHETVSSKPKVERRAPRRRGILAAALLALILAGALGALAGAALAAPAGGSAAAPRASHVQPRGTHGARPSRPTALTPNGTVTTVTPTFTWTKARGANRYEVRVYQGSELLVSRTGIRTRSWTSRLALPTNVSLTWKVRGSKAGRAGPWSAALPFTIVPPSSDKAITAFSFQGLTPPVVGTINETAHTIALTVPAGTNVTALVATFTTTGTSVTISGTPQVSGTTANTFSNPVTYTVTAADGSTQNYVVTVTVASTSTKAITAFSFQGLTPPVVGTINETAHTIALTVPAGTNVTALVATFTTTGSSVKVGTVLQTSGLTPNDFTHPVTYTVTAADASTQSYVVTVTVASSSTKAITAFSFQGLTPPAVGTINETAHTIAVTVPSGTDRTHLVATFTTTGASVTVGGTPQTSGVTSNDFTTPVTYRVTAGDASTQDYVVTVTAAGLAVGDPYQGGIVAYILQPGDPGYVAGETRGLIAAPSDQSTAAVWSNVPSTLVGTTGTGLGTGADNTAAIAAQPGCVSGAAYLCDTLVLGGYSDWYLPSKDELNELYANRAAIGGFTTDAHYWSSSEDGASWAWFQSFGAGEQGSTWKSTALYVRAVRSFPAPPPSSAKAITAFSFQGLTPAATGIINESAHTIAVSVPLGTDRTALVATFTTTGASVTVGGTPQVSGVTSNDFTNPVTYRVTAADASMQDYVVTVTVVAPAVGDAYQGGIVAYILQPGDAGYVAGQTHGLIVTGADQSSGAEWSNVTITLVGGSSTAIGSGMADTNAIVSQAGCTGGAAYICYNLAAGDLSGTYSDWYLPSRDELSAICLNNASLGSAALTAPQYWSSSEYTAQGAWYVVAGGSENTDFKNTSYAVRAVRSF